MPKPRKQSATNATPKKAKAKHGGEWCARFLEIFGMTLNVALAAHGAGVNRTQVYRERDRNPQFAEQLREAKAAAIERLEAAAYERAKNVSDTLLIFLLKSHKPELYRESVSLKHSGTVNLNFSELAALAAEDEQ